MAVRSFADMVYQSLSFEESDLASKLVLDLIDTPWMQRLRDISQTANTRLVYMFSEHSRFGHSLGVAYMALELLQKLTKEHNSVEQYKAAVAAAALLHDLGHIAPGSHSAQRAWYPNSKDQHENGTIRIIQEDPIINKILKNYDQKLPELVCKILAEDPNIPAWTWQIISGGGWNVDRGNWCIVDSILAGVNYGKYNIPALTDSLSISGQEQLVLRENRLDAMIHFAVSRHAMYRQIYQHRVLLSADTIPIAIIKRLRSINSDKYFADEQMQIAINSKAYLDLPLATINHMRESWWRYHVTCWLTSNDQILKDLSERLINRRLFKTIKVQDTQDPIIDKIKDSLKHAGFDPDYYLHLVSTANMHKSESKRSMLVLKENGEVQALGEADPIFNTLVSKNSSQINTWICIPEEVKINLGIAR